MLQLTHSKHRLMISILLGGGVAISTWLYLKVEMKKINSHANLTTVLVAKKYIPVGKEVHPDAVEEISIPEAYLEPKALERKAALLGEEGKINYKARIGILKGEQISRSKLLDETASLGLAWTLAANQTAVSLKLEPEQAVGGYVRPGDWVSVFGTFEKETQMILKRVQVMAIQDQLWEAGSLATEKMVSKITPNENILVTLALDKRQAALALLVVEKGKVNLALLPSSDTTPPEPVTVTMSDLYIR